MHGSRQPKFTLHVTDRYFFEELSRIAGPLARDRWLRSEVARMSVMNHKSDNAPIIKSAATQQTINLRQSQNSVKHQVSGANTFQNLTSREQSIFKCLHTQITKIDLDSESYSTEDLDKKIQEMVLSDDDYGLLYTDAAYLVQSNKRRKGEIFCAPI
jgi:hypothetical protein